jgi:ribonuclease J
MENNLTITPLAGSSELGINCVLVEYKAKLILLNLGAGIVDRDLGQPELVVPNLDYLIENKARIEGIFISSAHSDNIGGIVFAIEALGFPDIFAHEVALDFLRKQLADRNLLSQVKLHSVKAGSVLKSDDLHIEFFALAETFPHSLGIYLHSPHQKVVYANRFNWNQDTLYPTDFNYLGKLSAQNIDLLILGSANGKVAGYTPDLSVFTKQLRDLVMSANGKTVVSLGSTNLSYITATIKLAEQIGYKVCLLGRTMQSAVTIAQKHELVHIAAGTLIHHKNINRINPKKLIILSAGKRTDLFDDRLQLLKDGYQGFNLVAHDQVLLVANRNESIYDFNREMNTRQVSVKLLEHLANDTLGYPHLAEQLMLTSLLQPKYVMPLGGETGDILNTLESLISVGSNAENMIAPTNGTVYSLNNGKLAHTEHLATTFTVITEQDSNLEISRIKSEKRALAQGILVVGIRLRGKESVSLRDLHIESRAFIGHVTYKSILNRWRAEIINIINDTVQQNKESQQIQSLVQNYLLQQAQLEVGKAPLIVINIFK